MCALAGPNHCKLSHWQDHNPQESRCAPKIHKRKQELPVILTIKHDGAAGSRRGITDAAVDVGLAQIVNLRMKEHPRERYKGAPPVPKTTDAHITGACNPVTGVGEIPSLQPGHEYA